MGFKVLGLKIANMRNIDLVDVDFKGRNFVELTGENGSGKSTMLDALFTAILGTKHFGRGFDGWRVIQKGEQKAMIKATIGNRERTIEIRRSITKLEGEEETSTGGSLSIIDSDGEKLGQEFLDRLLSEFTIDPVSFSRKSAKEQVETLKRLGGIDTTAFETRKKKAEEDRLEATREVNRLKAKVAVPLDPVEEIKVESLIAQRQAIEKQNVEIRKKVTAKDELVRAKEVCVTRRAAFVQDIKELEEKIATLNENVRLLNETEAEKIKAIEAMVVPEEDSTEAVDAMIADAGRVNVKFAAYTQYLADKKAFDEATALAKKHDDEVKAAVEGRKKAIKESKLPFKNIEFDDEAGVVVDGVLFSQKSDAEKLRMSTRIGMEMDPELRVICIREGSLLDENSYAIVKELAERHDYQILVESVGEKPGDDQIVLRAGHIISTFEHVETTEAKVRNMDDAL